MDPSQSPTTPTLPEGESANSRDSQSPPPSPDMSSCPKEMRLNWKKALPMWDQSLSPLMPATTASKYTNPESTTSPDAAHCPWTTQSWWSDMELRVDRTIGWSRTAGAPPGERRATSRCPGIRTTTAESQLTPSTPNATIRQLSENYCEK